MNKVITIKNDMIKIGLFLINPIMGFFVSLFKVNSKSSYLIFYLFSFLFGISFVVPLDRSSNYTGDGVVYRQKFENFSKYSENGFNYLLDEYLEFNEGDKDFYVLTMSFLVSRFTDNYHWVFGIYAIVFSFFMLKSLRFLTGSKHFQNSISCILLVVIFVMSNPIFNINGVRFWTAAWIGVYSLFQIFRNNDKKYLILAFITPFVHVSFFFFIGVLVIAILFSKYNQFWFILFVISFFISESSFLILESVEKYFPEFISRTIRLYTDPDIIQMKESSKVWYIDIINFLQRLIVNFIILKFYKNRNIIKEDSQTYNLYLFLMVWMALVNFTMTVPSLGVRFFQLSIPIIVYIWLVFFNNRNNSNWIKAYYLAFSYSYLYLLSLIFKVTEIEFYITNPLYLIFNYL